ncbi:MAG: hypothetical protein BWY78_00027 [Alphaproteobacteria bacterium ADurb.Bin438]|nr:MAG: hypothetical protein BWY78_00027 [Alphaproteobacteria bacterium ADurb.Bin438]
MLFEYQLKTNQDGLFDITDAVMDAVNKSGVKQGTCLVYCPHTTAGITINENADKDVKTDFIYGLNKFIPNLKEFQHMEGNSDAHIKSSLVGVSENLIIHDGNLLLGIWQSVYFAEFDAPRNRSFYVKVSG